MDLLYSYSYRKQLFKSFSRQFIKYANSNIRNMDFLVFEYCILTLKEEYNQDKTIYDISNVNNKYKKFEILLKDLKTINNLLSYAKVILIQSKQTF